MQAGNPCLDDLITKLKTTYSRQAWGLGYAEQSAKSLPFEQYDQLCTALYTEACTLLTSLAAAAQQPMADRFRAAKAAMLLLRDLAAFTLAWESAVRGGNAGRPRGADLQDRRGRPLLPQLLSAVFPFPAGFLWQFAPDGTKPRQARRAGSLEMEVLPDSAKHRDFLRILHKLIQVS